jgi:hypothetical protein
VHVVTINKFHASRDKSWLAPNESRTRDLLTAYDKQRNLLKEVMHAGRR